MLSDEKAKLAAALQAKDENVQQDNQTIETLRKKLAKARHKAKKAKGAHHTDSPAKSNVHTDSPAKARHTDSPAKQHHHSLKKKKHRKKEDDTNSNEQEAKIKQLEMQLSEEKLALVKFKEATEAEKAKELERMREKMAKEKAEQDGGEKDKEKESHPSDGEDEEDDPLAAEVIALTRALEHRDVIERHIFKASRRSYLRGPKSDYPTSASNLYTYLAKNDMTRAGIEGGSLLYNMIIKALCTSIKVNTFPPLQHKAKKKLTQRCLFFLPAEKQGVHRWPVLLAIIQHLPSSFDLGEDRQSRGGRGRHEDRTPQA